MQETHLGIDKNIIKWYNEWGGKSFLTVDSTNSKGVSVLINPKYDYNVLNASNSGDGRIISVEIDGTNRLNIVNLYAPNNKIERRTFFDKAVSKFLSQDIENMLAGDCTLYDKDRHKQKPNSRKTTETGKLEIINLKADYEMCDIYSKWKPKNRNFTYFNPHSVVRSRIDFIITSNYMYPWVTDSGTNITSFSDHYAAYVMFNMSSEDRGPGRWKMNSNVIKSKLFSDTFNSFWTEWTTTKNSYNSLLDWWSETKNRVRDIAIWCSKRLSGELKSDQCNIEKQLQNEQEKIRPNIAK